MREGKPRDQAAAQCYSMWEQYKGDSVTIQSGLRFDFNSSALQVTKSDEGYLKGTAPVAKVGIMTYYLLDGSTRREFVPPETLFANDSMETLKMKPITNIHPPERILDSETVKRRKVGFTGEQVVKDDQFLASSLVITDSDAVNDAENGRRQLSPGYRCEIELSPGVYNGEHYDAIQRKRTYNHLALVDSARGGSDLKLNMDGKHPTTDNGVRLDGYEVKQDEDLSYEERKDLPDSAFAYVKEVDGKKIRKFPVPDATHVRNALARLPQSNLATEEKVEVKEKLKKVAKKYNIEVSDDGFSSDYIDYNLTIDEKEFINSKKGSRMEMTTISINNLDYQCAPEVKVHIDNLNNEKNDLKTNLDKAKADLDSANDKIKKLEGVNVDEEVKKGVKARVSLERDAYPHLDEEDQKKLDSMDDKAIKTAVILKAFPNAKEQLTDASDAYIDARYDSALDILKKEKEKSDSNMSNQRRDSRQDDGNYNNNNNDNENKISQDESRKNMIERMEHPEKFNEDGSRKK